jgi:hypothetical protein
MTDDEWQAAFTTIKATMSTRKVLTSSDVELLVRELDAYLQREVIEMSRCPKCGCHNGEHILDCPNR